MDKKTIQDMLQDELEKEIPSADVHLWPAVKANLVAGTIHQGEKMNSINSPRIRRVALATLVVIVFLAVAFVTPQGRAFAQSILQFFTRAETNSFPEDVIEPNPLELTAEPPASLITLREAEIRAGFDVAELPMVPAGFNYLGARMYRDAISLEYEAQGGGGNLILMQSKDGFVQSEWDKVPGDAIVPVRIGNVDGEFAQGTFVVKAGETSATWNSSAPILRLRWLKDDIWFDLTKYGDVEVIEYLDQAGMIELASRVTTNPFALTMEEVEKYAGYNVMEPVVIPEGMTFLGASFDPALKMASISIGYSESERIILVNQQPVDLVETCTLCGVVGASALVQAVQINNMPGEYAEGVWELTNNGPVWRDYPFLKTLRWQIEGQAFEIIFMGDGLVIDDLIAVAESIK
ncbi:MAG: hypothetical protein M3R47_20045 [Chloroflexota bacterium]|nr:hypothetical protein [Chloroflexota bacterium]